MVVNRKVTKLRQERELRGWSRQYIVDQVGIDLVTVGRWERGERIPQPHYRQQLCELFHLNTLELGLQKPVGNSDLFAGAETDSEAFSDEDQALSHACVLNTLKDNAMVVTPLRQERELRGWSRHYIAERVGVDLASVGRWERGERIPHPHYRQQLCELFQMNALELGLQKPIEFHELSNYNEPDGYKVGAEAFTNQALAYPVPLSLQSYSQQELVSAHSLLGSRIVVTMIACVGTLGLFIFSTLKARHNYAFRARI